MKTLIKRYIAASTVIMAAPVVVQSQGGLSAGTFDGSARLVSNDACAGTCNMSWPFQKCCEDGKWVNHVWCSDPAPNEPFCGEKCEIE